MATIGQKAEYVRSQGQIANLKKLAEAATPGPWAYEAHGDTMDYGVGVLIDPCSEGEDKCAGEQISGVMIVAESVAVEVKGQANAAFIAAANPQTILAIIAALEACKPLLAGGVMAMTEAMIEAGAKVLFERLRSDVYDPDDDRLGRLPAWDELGETARESWRSDAEITLTAALTASPAPAMGNEAVVASSEEGLAKALYLNEYGGTWETADSRYKDKYRRIARAALAALNHREGE